MTHRPFAAALAVSLLLATSAPAGPPQSKSAPSPRKAPALVAEIPGSPALTALSALDSRATDAAVASLLDMATAEPARAEEVAVSLLLLDRNDAALEVLLDAGLHAQAFELLWGERQIAEALALPFDESNPAAMRMRARALAGIDRRDEALSLAVDLVGSSPPARARGLLSSLWPARSAEADAAASWLTRQGGVSRADETLLRVRDILDPESRSRDAEQVVRDAELLLSSISPCEMARIGAGLVGIATLRKQDDAALAIARTWASSSDMPMAWTTLGDELAKRSLWREAASAFGRAAELSPQDGAARWMQASMLERAGDGAGAKGAFEAARQAATQSCSRQRLTLAMDRSGHGEPARELRELILTQEEPGSAAFAQAAGALSRLAQAPAGDAMLASLGSSFDEARRRAAARPLDISRVLPIVRAAQRAQLGIAAATGDLDAALALSEHALEPFLSNGDATADIVLALRAAGRTSEADALLSSVAERLEEAAVEHPDSPRLLNTQAWLAARVRTGLEEARTAAERAAELAPTNAGILDTLAEVRFQLGDREGALEAGRRALELAPERAYLEQQLVRFVAGDPATPPPLHLE